MTELKFMKEYEILIRLIEVCGAHRRGTTFALPAQAEGFLDHIVILRGIVQHSYLNSHIEPPKLFYFPR